MSPLGNKRAALAGLGRRNGLGLGFIKVDPRHHRDDANFAVLRVAGRVISGVPGVGALHVQRVAGLTDGCQAIIFLLGSDNLESSVQRDRVGQGQDGKEDKGHDKVVQTSHVWSRFDGLGWIGLD